MKVEKQLVPVLREGIGVIKMIFFQKLKPYLSENHPDLEQGDVGRLAGAIINEVFGTPNRDPSFVAFADRNRAIIDEEVDNLSEAFEELRIPLTDALRMQFLCDVHEGGGDDAVLARAKERNILIADRDVPLPKFFMNTVRRLGVACNILSPESLALSAEEEPH